MIERNILLAESSFGEKVDIIFLSMKTISSVEAGKQIVTRSMNMSYILRGLLFLHTACSTTVTRNESEITFLEREHDFGFLSFNNATEYGFEFSNPGETPLVIRDVKTSCGCTVAQWTKTPVKPGKSGTIKVRYDAAFPGVFQKEITVYYNGPGSPFILKIKGEVNYPDEPQTENQ